jgi:ABC-type branched-subunit amino acid transport system ATPase component
VPKSFTELAEDFFSLGQDENYYEQLGAFDDKLRQAITSGLHDLVASPQLWDKVADEPVMDDSLTRGIRMKTIRDQFRRLLDGGARLSPYNFSYAYPKRTHSDGTPNKLTFEVSPESSPPSNIHILIGRNGVGKTHTLHLMTKSLIAESPSARQSGHFASDSAGADKDEVPFANLVSVSFSAFDNFNSVPEIKETKSRLQYSYIGLRRNPGENKTTIGPKSPEMLAKEFIKSAKACLMGPRAKRWNRLLGILETDPLFKAAEVANTLAEADDFLVMFDDHAETLFNKLSSGHKIVLLTIARLVETVDEKTLVLIDEPEAHLHPPLLSAFTRALSDLLVNRNGVAIIATHSPVILQEVPKECVWKLTRKGTFADSLRPTIETFGENVGVLTREIFGLEVAKSGFHRLLKDAVAKNATYEEALHHFEGKLGAEGRAILRSMYNEKLDGAEE